MYSYLIELKFRVFTINWGKSKLTGESESSYVFILHSRSYKWSKKNILSRNGYGLCYWAGLHTTRCWLNDSNKRAININDSNDHLNDCFHSASS